MHDLCIIKSNATYSVVVVATQFLLGRDLLTLELISTCGQVRLVQSALNR